MEKIKLLSFYYYKNFIRSKSGKAIFFSIPIFLLFLSMSLFSFKEPENKFLSSGYELTIMVVFLLATFTSSDFICSEIKEKTIQLLFTKPIKEKDIIISKWISVNLIILNTIVLYFFTFHLLGLILFKKYFPVIDLTFLTIFISSLLISSFTFFLTSVFPTIATAIFILIFGTGLTKFVLNSLSDVKTYNFFGLIAKKIGIYLSYFLFYLFPSYNNLIIKPDEISWSKPFWLGYLKFFIYGVLITIFYLMMAIYIFKLKRKSYLKSI